MSSGAPRSVRKYKQPMWMKVPYRVINRSIGSCCCVSEGNNEDKAHNERTDKLQQLSLVKPINSGQAVGYDETCHHTGRNGNESTVWAIRGNMLLRVSQRLRMNVGDPNSMGEPP